MQPAPIKQVLSESSGLASRVWIGWFQLVQNLLGTVAIETIRITSTNSPYSVTNQGINLVCNTNSGAIVVNLAKGEQGVLVRVVNVGSSGNSVTVNGNSENIKGAASQAVTDGQVLEVRFDSIEGWY